MNKSERKLLSVILSAIFCVMLCFGMVACSSGQSKTAASEKSTGAVQIKDALGNDFSLDAPVSKLVGTHNPTLNAIVVAGGGGQYLAGFGNKEKADGLYSKVIENWDSVVSIGKGKNINLETTASLGADLALLPERQKGMAEEYAKIDLKSFIALPNQESFDTVKESLARVGALVGEDQRVEKINAKFDEIIKRASKAAQKNATNKSVLFMGDDLYEIAFDSMIQTDIIKAVGAKNAVTGDYKQGEFASVDAETIVSFNPDVIWIPNYANYTVEDLLKDAKLADITAVKNGDVYMFPCSLEPWDYPTASTCLGVSWAAYNLNPEAYTLKDVKADCDDFYNFVYGKTFTEEELGLK